MATGIEARITVEKGKVVKVERGVPRSRREAWKGQTDLKYIDAQERNPADRFLFQAAYELDAEEWSDGTHVGEVRGPDIEGNPTKIDKVVFMRKVLQS